MIGAATILIGGWGTLARTALLVGLALGAVRPPERPRDWPEQERVRPTLDRLRDEEHPSLTDPPYVEAPGIETVVIGRQLFGKTRAEVERHWGIAQAVLVEDQDHFVLYYGTQPRDDGSAPLVLGPVEITYSQYDTVLGKVYYPDALSEQCAPHGLQGVRLAERLGELWLAMFKRIKVGMSRSEVQKDLQIPQAYEQLLVEPYASGPSIPHEEVFYGPAWPSSTPQVVSLGPVTVLFIRGPSGAERARIPLRRQERSGLSIQSWEPAVCRPEDIPIEEGWRARYERIEIGMARPQVERIIGHPTCPTTQPRRWPQEWRYGPRQRIRWPSSLMPCNKIWVRYSSDNSVMSRSYWWDEIGYEAASGQDE